MGTALPGPGTDGAVTGPGEGGATATTPGGLGDGAACAGQTAGDTVRFCELSS